MKIFFIALIALVVLFTYVFVFACCKTSARAEIMAAHIEEQWYKQRSGRK